MPRAEDVMQVPRLGDLGRPDRASELVLPLQHADAPPASREQGRARQRVDAATDDDGVECTRHQCSEESTTAVHSISIRQPGTARPVIPTIVWAGCSAPPVTSSIARVIVSYSVGSVVYI